MNVQLKLDTFALIVLSISVMFISINIKEEKMQNFTKLTEIDCIGCPNEEKTIIADDLTCSKCGQIYHRHLDERGNRVTYPLIGQRKNIAIVEGWKGTSGIIFKESGNNFILKEFRKDKHMGNVQEIQTIVKAEDIEFL